MDWKRKFQGIFEPSLIQELESRAKELRFEAGETIVDIGQTVRFLPFILEGSVKITRLDENGREILLYYLSANEGCAITITCCMQQYPSEIRAVAEEHVSLLAVPNTTAIDEWLVKYPTWKGFIMRTIRSRFNELLKAIDQLAFQNLDVRLIEYLKVKSRESGSSLINLSDRQIAEDLASSRVVIGRLLKKLENYGKLILFQDQIKILKEL